jgi:two-component system, NarL family, sensor kinase
MVTESLGQVTPLTPVEDPGPTTSGFFRSLPQRELAAFLLIPVLVLVAVAAGTVLASERIARANALAEAERTAVRVAQLLVAPVLADALAGLPGRWQELERILATRMRDGSISTVVVWSAEGEIVFSSDPDLVGERIEPSDELLTAIGGTTLADVDDDPETAYDGEGDGPMVEVYVPLSVRGEPMAVETYFSHDGIDRQASLLRWEIIPVAVGALVLLQLVQVPIAMSLARRVRRHETERAELMSLSLTASERERRAIAADVHDGPVQDLAGISYALGALRATVPPERQDTVERLAVAVRNALQSLRRLMTDIYPPDLSGPGLAMALTDLTEPLQAQGIVVSLDVEPPPELSPAAAAAIYRTAKEALVNVAKHAEASRVWVCLERTEHDGQPAALLEIADDGVGFPETGTDRRREGHLGLRVLVDRIEDLGGTVELGKRLSGGAVLTAVIPLLPLR